MASSTDQLRATMQSTLTAFLENYTLAVRNKDVSLLSATLSEDCTRHLKPASFINAYPFLNAAESNSEYEARMVAEIAAMEEARVKVLESAADPAALKASALAEHWTKFAGREGTSLEICWYLDFTADGKKISRVTEFIDTVVATKMIEALIKEGLFKTD